MTSETSTHKLKRPLLIGGGILIFLLILSGLISVVAVDELVDIWWFDSMGYLFYYWQRQSYQYIVFFSVTIFFFLIFFLNFQIAARVLRRIPDMPEKADKKSTQILKYFQSGSLLFYTPLSLLLSLPLAIPIYHHWEKFLFYIFGSDMGVKDPFFSTDISFYLFSIPIYSLLQRRLLVAVVVLLIALLILYIIKNRILTKRLFDFSNVAKWHLSLLLLVVFGLEILDFILQRYGLAYDVGHQPLFSGPGYVQMMVTLPLIWLSLFSIAAAAVSLVIVLQFKKGHKVFIGSLIGLALILGLRYTDYLPEFVQTYWVKPNEVIKESPYIEKNITSTLDAFNLSDVETRNFEHQRFPVNTTATQVQNVLRNIPVWDAGTLKTVYEQLQELRTYYTFPQVSVGRYTVSGQYQQVFMSMRELGYDQLPGATQNWINDHLLYTHGYGAVMSSASQEGGESMNWYLHNIPPKSDYGLDLAEPRIYYGLNPYPYALAPNKVGELDYPKGNSNAKANYQGTGGVPISSLMRKFLFAYYLKDKNIFLSTKVTGETKLLFRRQIMDRIRTIAPFLLLDENPYAVYTPKGLFWIVDAYTHSDYYPAAPMVSLNGVPMNYVRNSVKIVVDAYNGNVDFYIYDTKDPIINAYDKIYPGLFKSRDKMPDDLKAHVRYPKDLFDIQMQIYAKYHQTDPQVFFQQEDLWTFAETQGQEEKSTVPDKPYYLTLDLINSGKLDFMLLLPMFPKGKDNLRSMAVAGCDGDNYGKIIIYDFPKGELVFGPAQINAMINQDPTIAREFTLWDQAGSSVVRGKMIILLVENSVFFIQPVYLKATSRVKIPELQRIIMSEGRVAVMKTSLEEAYMEIQQRAQKDIRRRQGLMHIQPTEPVPDEQTDEQTTEPAVTKTPAITVPDQQHQEEEEQQQQQPEPPPLPNMPETPNPPASE
ncbi:UPF0182 family protein [uncultured Desulfobacter sp.]|uniref:UPF0182 family protein n=1 Tax=uncultured Desulfobacter sp. TaxID=240139 RepID=UPI0029F47269|nr:UPF0182 family protein [uncultured Desulfobacter sp.]